jgi:hypothetical protein
MIDIPAHATLPPGFTVPKLDVFIVNSFNTKLKLFVSSTLKWLDFPAQDGEPTKNSRME